MTPMDLDKTETLVNHLEAALRRLGAENYSPPGSCCACLQDVATVGHLPNCHLAAALVEVANWRAGASNLGGGQANPGLVQTEGGDPMALLPVGTGENSPQTKTKLAVTEGESRRPELVDGTLPVALTPMPPTSSPVTRAQVAFMTDLEQRYQGVSGLQDRSAYKIFYGPVRPAPVMVLGINPGGDPADVVADSLYRRNGLDSAASISFYEHEECDLLDCNWPENRGLMKLLVPLFNGDQAKIRAGVVKTNIAFRRSKKKTSIDFENAKREAAPFLLEILGVVQPRLILLTSVDLTTFAKTFGASVTPLAATIRDDRVGQVVFEAATVALSGTGTDALVVRVAHASQFSWTYERYDVVSRIQALGFP